MTTTLYRRGRILSPIGGGAAGGATALVVTAADGSGDAGGVVSWIGREPAAEAITADEVVDLDGALLGPAFVDAHVHATATGLALTGLDLTDAPTLAVALDRLAAHVRTVRGGVVIGTGWDDSRWPERRPPTRGELDRASFGGVVYLARTDVHSAVASSALLAAVPEAAGLPGFGPDGLVALGAHHAVRRAALAAIGRGQRRAAQRAALQRAAALGIASVHEMAGPDVSSEDDLADLLDLAGDEPGPEVVGYWADLGDVETSRRLGLRAAGGDLFCDGTLGSRTAALGEAYADEPGHTGSLHHDAGEIAAHVQACVPAGLQPAFHVIGDRAVQAVIDGLAAAAAAVGVEAVRSVRPRLEHVEMPTPAAMATMAALGTVASVQPGFDAAWGGPAGMYATRLGPDRARRLNPFAAFAAAGVTLALGSDSPVTPLDPWGGVQAAVAHRTPGSRLTPVAAFAAHTSGGRHAARQPDDGLRPGATATFAVWCEPGGGAHTGGLTAAVLPDPVPEPAQLRADPSAPRPLCLRTVVRGRTIFEREGAFS